MTDFHGRPPGNAGLPMIISNRSAHMAKTSVSLPDARSPPPRRCQARLVRSSHQSPSPGPTGRALAVPRTACLGKLARTSAQSLEQRYQRATLLRKSIQLELAVLSRFHLGRGKALPSMKKMVARRMVNYPVEDHAAYADPGSSGSPAESHQRHHMEHGVECDSPSTGAATWRM